MNKLSAAGVALLEKIEAFRSKAYLDQKGVPTIGIGSTRIKGKPVKLGMVCTYGQALGWLHEDVAEASRVLNTMYPELTQNQFDALVIFFYNVGEPQFRSSTLCKTLLRGGTVTQRMFTDWNKVTNPETGIKEISNGLVARRKREFALFTSEAQ